MAGASGFDNIFFIFEIKLLFPIIKFKLSLVNTSGS